MNSRRLDRKWLSLSTPLLTSLVVINSSRLPNIGVERKITLAREELKMRRLNSKKEIEDINRAEDEITKAIMTSRKRRNSNEKAYSKDG